MTYEIGDYVIVSQKMIRVDNNGIKWKPLELTKPRLGQIVGLATRYDGKVVYPSYSYYGEMEDGPCFQFDKTHTFWLVRFGLRNKPICAQEDHIRLATLDEIYDIPILFTRQLPWPDDVKKAISEDSKHWPRDSKGRWARV